jgi:tetratricopeptide (TPR) repeat protein
LAHDLLRAGLVDEALDVVEGGWARVLRGGGRAAGVSLHRLATARAYLLLARGRFAEARDTVRHARSLEGENPDFVFFEASCDENEALRCAASQARRELLERAHDGYARCLRFADQVFSQSFVFGASTWCGATRLGTVQLLLGRPRDALATFDGVLASRPKDRAVRLGKVEALLDGGDPGAALGELEPWLDDAAPDAWVLAAVAVHTMEERRPPGRRSHSEDARLFATRAGALAGKGFIAPHRRERLRGLVERWSSARDPSGGPAASHR